MSETAELENLNFDRTNPRLAEFGIQSTATDEEIIRILWETMDVRELTQSIAASGFFQHEPLIVAREARKLVVIEGNRRLAAVKLLVEPSLAQHLNVDVPPLTTTAVAKLQKLPVVYMDRKSAWRTLGFKHVNGPAKWSSFAKAKYIADVHNDYSVPLAEIAEQIGDRHRTVERLYRGLMVLNQAEKRRVFKRENKWHSRFAFSHLYTGLELDGISTFLGINDDDVENREPVPRTKIQELGEVMSWLYGNREKGEVPVVEKQNPNLRELDAVLKNREAVAALRNERDLSSALELSRRSRRFLKSLF